MKSLLRVMSEIPILLFGLFSSILIILISITGCSDTPYTGKMTSYTGSMLTASDVDDYLTSIRGGIYCIHNDAESSCINLVSLIDGEVENRGPVIHIYPEKTVYLFHHEDKLLVRAERTGDTTDLVVRLEDPEQDPPDGDSSIPRIIDVDDDDNNNNNNGGDDGDNNNNNNGSDDNDNNNGRNDGDNNNNNNNGGNDGDNNNNGGNNNGGDAGTPADDDDDNNNNGGDNDNGDNPENTVSTDKTGDGHGWLIWIYYPVETAPIDPPTLSASNVTITINGKQLIDADITGFAQFIGNNGERGIQFFYPIESAELLDLYVQMEGITDLDGNVRFNINYLWRSY